ncbi:hypothetical protein SEPCBS119000_006226 [Sporothrix epigloea]|uniref:FAD-binding FR-type domain-containing protein n=1 Tax=Sporothrix epigloea TaxID=1892477 RepID=A0ABP0E4H4_9PEZI
MLFSSRVSLAAAAAALFSATTVHAWDTPLQIVTADRECGITMFDIYGTYKWTGIGYGKRYVELCRNPNALISIYASLYTYCKPEEIEPSMHVMAQWCEGYGDKIMIPASEFAANLTKEAIAALPIVQSKAALPPTTNITAPFMVSKPWFEMVRVSYHLYAYGARNDAYSGFAAYGFWALILAFGIIQNVVRKIIVARRGYVYVDAEGSTIRPGAGGKAGVFGRAAAVVRKYVVTPSSMPPYHQQRLMGCSIPTRAESFAVFSYWSVAIILSFVNYHGQTNSYFLGKNSMAPQIWRYIGNRMGVMSYSNLPLMWMFSGRNNIFLWATGWSFGTFNIFHRHIARIATLQAIIHSIAYTAMYVGYGRKEVYTTDIKQLWLIAGVIGTVAMSVIVFLSLGYFRRKFYEHFLLIHIVLSAALIAFLYQHTATRLNNPFLVPCYAIWGFDRFLRIVRQVYTNLHVRSGKGLITSKSVVTYHEAANILTIDIVPANKNVFPGPGQHYYIYQPFRFFGWENHPFTLAHWTKPATASDDLHLQFWIRPYDGWTKHLVKQCKAKGGSTMTITPTLLLEGPYLAHEPVHTFEQVLLIAGGSGIAGVMPYLQDYTRRIEQGAAAGDSGKIPTRTRKVTLIWADRREEYVRFIAEGPLAGLSNRPDIDVSFYVTNEPETTGESAAATPLDASSSASTSTENVTSCVTPVDQAVASEKSAEEEIDEKSGVFASVSALKKQAAMGGFRIQYGRPEVLATVRKMAESIHGTDSRMAVMVCGPGVLSDDVRHVVAQNMETSRESITYFEDSFGW